MYESLSLISIYSSKANTSVDDLVAIHRYPHISPSDYRALQEFCNAHFSISGTIRIMPSFMVSNNARESLFYPQAFVIFESNENYYTERENFQSYEICYTLDGTGYLEYNQKSYTLKKGEGFFINCRQKHLYKTLGGTWNSTVLHFDGILAENFFNQFSKDGSVKFSQVDCPNFEMYQYELLKTAEEVIPYKEYRISCLFDSG